jgi:bifunctional non-homologous end joining protein LigD
LGARIKHDGYRLMVCGTSPLVRLFTRRGYDWTDRYPAIAETAARLSASSFTIDGEAVVCGPDGVAVFNALHRRHKAHDAVPRWSSSAAARMPEARKNPPKRGSLTSHPEERPVERHAASLIR